MPIKYNKNQGSDDYINNVPITEQISNQDSNEYYKGKDIRYIMNDITQINNIESSNLKIDQELKVPVI